MKNEKELTAIKIWHKLEQYEATVKDLSKSTSIRQNSFDLIKLFMKIVVNIKFQFSDCENSQFEKFNLEMKEYVSSQQTITG